MYKSESYQKDNSAVYSDRMLSWDSAKFERCTKEVWGNAAQLFTDRIKEPAKINKFLNLYFEKEVELTAILQGCNQSNGFPYWVFCYFEI